MPAIDLIIAATFLLSTVGVLVVRALRAWSRFRVQERTVRVLTEAVIELERPRERT